MVNNKYLISAGVFMALAVFTLKKLDSALKEYEADQPDACAEYIFRTFFVKDDHASFLETSNGLSNDRKYLALYDNHLIAAFLLEPVEPKEAVGFRWRLKEIRMVSPSAMEASDFSTMKEEQKKVVAGALRARAEYMINAEGSAAALKEYYDTDSAAYSELTEIGRELWMNEDDGHTFRKEGLDRYTPYSDNLFSARGYCTMNVYCTNDDSYRDFDMEITMFFRKINGQWLCFETTNV